ncbi:MAG: plastocyanin/azurin family copper-binding protein [Planctomycetota bacterium]|nr:plastocyanin/azurin family copper-binding protein [Planctomycetota bacterium]MDA1113456.1 plastocyanin/azurin family copper-binding protein [Planctomycetota bacterium]
MKSTSLLKTGLVLVAGLTLSAAATAQNNHIVKVAPSGFVFEPQDINVNVGDTVTWVWFGGASHNVRALSGAFLSGNPVVAPNTFSVTFDGIFLAANPVAGDLYDYRCAPHAFVGMVGSVKVMSPRVLSVTNFTAGQSGSIDVDGLNPGGTVMLGYSLAGSGPISISFGSLALSPPVNQLPALTADSYGHASMPVNLPGGFAGTTVHLHGAELFGGGEGILTNPLTVVL